MGRSTINLAPADVGVFEQSYDEEFDMAEVKGQESVKRALEIAAAVGHNALTLWSHNPA
jgi:predicted ATPase with chaperone activity